MTGNAGIGRHRDQQDSGDRNGGGEKEERKSGMFSQYVQPALNLTHAAGG